MRYIVRTEVWIVPEGSRTNNTIRTDSQCSYANGFSFKLYFLLLRNKISLQSVEIFNRTYFFRHCCFSVVLISNQWSNGIVSHIAPRNIYSVCIFVHLPSIILSCLYSCPFSVGSFTVFSILSFFRRFHV